jgi:transcriptional regulator with XRE-family HTH domain
MSTTNQHDVEVGAKLRDLRLRYTIKQSDLAARLAVQRSTVTRYEQGARSMTVDMLLQIADIFGVPACRLLPNRHQEQPASPIVGSAVQTQPSLEDDAIESIIRVLREHPELLVDVMTFIEQRMAVQTT